MIIDLEEAKKGCKKRISWWKIQAIVLLKRDYDNIPHKMTGFFKRVLKFWTEQMNSVRTDVRTEAKFNRTGGKEWYIF